MNANFPHYSTGQEIHAGDAIRYKKHTGTIAFVSDGQQGQFASGFADYCGFEAGIMVSNDDGELTLLSEPDEDLEFIGRGSLLTHEFDSPALTWPPVGV